MIPITAEPPDPMPYNYLPHHGVPHHSGLTDKLRVVFNGSNKSDNGVSLNDLVHTGIKLQIDPIDFMLWFWKFRYVFATDVEKVYRQIAVHPDDCRFQRILWKDLSGNIVTYALTTITYGHFSPFLALRTMKGRYVDDIFGGADSIAEVQQIIDQVKQLYAAGKLPLQKWVSNNPDLLLDNCTEHKLPLSSVSIDPSSSISTLDLAWRPLKDVFYFSIEPISLTSLTKRSISSPIARLFDPMGFLAPVTIRAKMLLQELWTLEIGWDDPVPTSISVRWLEFIQQLPAVSNFKV